jgi:hypothetical protein
MQIGMRIKVHIISRTGKVSIETYGWLNSHRLDFAVSVDRHNVITNRNSSVQRFLLEDVPKGYTHLMQIDDDAVLIRESQSILTEQGDVVYLGMKSRNGQHAHYGNDDFGCTAFRLSAELLQKMDKQGKPIFDFVYNAKKTQAINCECNYFRSNAEALGYKSKMVGLIGHNVSCCIKPAGEQGQGTDISFI